MTVRDTFLFPYYFFCRHLQSDHSLPCNRLSDLCECILETGRTHQIRVHLRSIQHPVCGDELYGFDRGVKVPCLMLHAYSLKFNHPRTKKEMAFQAPLPEDFRKGLKSNGIEIGSEV